MTVPSARCSATGVRVSRTDHGNGTTTYVHEQGNVHDFAWTVDPHFIEGAAAIRSRPPGPGRGSARDGRSTRSPHRGMRLSDVDVILLMQPEHFAQTERYLRAAMLAIAISACVRPLSAPDHHDRRSGAWRPWDPAVWSTRRSSPRALMPCSATGRSMRLNIPEEGDIHEFGHQFWQGLVANNEFEEAWLDEGVNSYSTGKILEIGYGRRRPSPRSSACGSARSTTSGCRTTRIVRSTRFVSRRGATRRGGLRLQQLRQARARAADARSHPGERRWRE